MVTVPVTLIVVGAWYYWEKKRVEMYNGKEFEEEE